MYSAKSWRREDFVDLPAIAKIFTLQIFPCDSLNKANEITVPILSDTDANIGAAIVHDTIL